MRKKWGLFLKRTIGLLFREKKLFFLVVSGLIFNLLGWLALKLFFPFGQETVILHYNAFLGIDEVEFAFSANRYKIFLPLVGGIFIWLINLLAGFSLCFFYKNRDFKEKNTCRKWEIELKRTHTNQLGAYLLWLAGDVVQGLILVYVVAIILINR